MGLDRTAARRAWATYAGESVVTRAFLAARLVVLPWGALDGELRALSGRVLSLGCGHGIVERYLAEINPDVVVDGVDLDVARVEAAARTASRSPRVALRVADVTRLESSASAYDAVLAVDVLHHVPLVSQPGVATALATALAPGGVCLVKDIGVNPPRKHRWNAVHDRLVAGPDPLSCRSPEAMAAVFESAGLVLERLARLDHASPYPHYLLRLRRPRR